MMLLLSIVRFFGLIRSILTLPRSCAACYSRSCNFQTCQKFLTYITRGKPSRWNEEEPAAGDPRYSNKRRLPRFCFHIQHLFSPYRHVYEPPRPARTRSAALSRFYRATPNTTATECFFFFFFFRQFSKFYLFIFFFRLRALMNSPHARIILKIAMVSAGCFGPAIMRIEKQLSRHVAK